MDDIERIGARHAVPLQGIIYILILGNGIRHRAVDGVLYLCRNGRNEKKKNNTEKDHANVLDILD
jgi:hypothetical protein